MARSTKTAPAGVATASAPDMPPVGQHGPLAAAPPAGAAPAVIAALMAALGATVAQLARAAGLTRAVAARELAALEKAGQASWDGSVSPAIWTARKVSGDAPGQDSPDALGLPSRSLITAGGTATWDMEARGAGNPDSAEDAGPATPASPAAIAPGADEALSAAAAATAEAETTLQAGDLAGALAAADHVMQAAARARLLRHAGRVARRGPGAGTLPGELRGLVAAHLAAYPTEDFGPHAIGRVLGRSSGAVANALDRLTALGQAQLTSEAPRRYRYASPPAAAS